MERALRWCVRPTPVPNELLSSWLHRLAIANALPDHTLCRHMFGRLAVWNRDVDRCFPDQELATLSGWTGLSETRLASMKLTHWAGRLSGKINKNGNSRWILPMGVYHRVRRRPGLLLCPLCLRDGLADAFWPWRMAWSLCCRRHRARLVEACPYCDCPYMPHRASPSLFGRSCCVRCGRDLGRLVPERADVWEWQFQQRLETVLTRGACQIDGNSYPALPLFDGLHILARVTLDARWADLATAVDVPLHGVVRSGKTRAVLELQPYAVRRAVMKVVWKLMQDWPVAFLDAIYRARLPRRAFVVEAYVPTWIQQIIESLPPRLRYATWLVSSEGYGHIADRPG